MDSNEISRIEVAITKLTEISSNMDKMLGIHEQRLNQQDKQIVTIETVIEKRREEAEIKLYDVYDTIKSEDKNILDKLNRMAEEASNQYTKVSDKINTIEHTIWVYMGGFSMVAFLIAYGKNILGVIIK